MWHRHRKTAARQLRELPGRAVLLVSAEQAWLLHWVQAEAGQCGCPSASSRPSAEEPARAQQQRLEKALIQPEVEER